MIMSANVQDQVQSILKSIQNLLAKLPTTKVLIWVWQQCESNALTIWLGMFGAPWYCCDGCACDRSTKVVPAGPIGLGGGYMECCCCCCCSGSILDLAVFGCGDSAGVNSIAKATVLIWNCRQLLRGILRVKSFSHVKKLFRSGSRLSDDEPRCGIPVPGRSAQGLCCMRFRKGVVCVLER